MKKLFFLAAIAAATLSACSSDEIVEQAAQKPVEDGAVMFSAYTARTTRAAVETQSTVEAKGFGVFAYDQGPVEWATYSASNTMPNFFYNQKVAYNHTSYDANTVTLAEWLAITDATVQGWYTASLAVVTSSVFTDAEMTELKALGSPWDTGWSESTDNNTAPTSATLTLAQYKALTTTTLQAKFEGTPSTTTTFTPAEFIELPASQQAYVTGTGGTAWEYSPIKYYNNNKGAKHSFFAYAPYKSDVKPVFALTKAPQIRYAMGVDDYDLMWGKRWNDTQATDVNVDVEKPGIAKTISFDFQHALSCISIEAVPFIDEVHTGDDHGSDTSDDADHDEFGELAAGTTVTLRSVKFVGAAPTTSLASQGLLNLATGKWTVEGTDEGAYEMTTATAWTGAITPDLRTIVTNKMLIPASDTGSTVKVQVVYDVTTTDPANPKNNSTITNTIESENSYNILPGTAYKFHLDLGLTAVKFTAQVTDWDTAQKEVDLPNNNN